MSTPEQRILAAVRAVAGPATTWLRAGTGIVLLSLVACAWWQLVGGARDAQRVPTDEVIVVVLLLPAAWVAWRAARRRARATRAGTAWLLVALALALNAVASAVQAWYHLPALPGGGSLPVWPVLLVLAVACHEAGHAAAAQLLGLEWQPFVRFPRAAGIAIRVPRGGLPPRDDLVIALAGPLASLGLAAAAYPLLPELGVLSALLGVINLLPFLRGSDGWRATRAARLLPGLAGASPAPSQATR